MALYAQKILLHFPSVITEFGVNESPRFVFNFPNGQIPFPYL